MIAADKLDVDGWEIVNVIEWEHTEKDDYFAPCSSLDAFICAEKDGIAVRYS